DPQVGAGGVGGGAAAWGALQEPELQQVGFVHVLDRVGVLAEGGGAGVEPERPACELPDDAAQRPPAGLAGAKGADRALRQRLGGGGERDAAAATELGLAPHALQQLVVAARPAPLPPW